MSEPTASGPNGAKLVYRGGKWQPLGAAPPPAAAPAPVKEPTATGPGGLKLVYRDGKWLDPSIPKGTAAVNQSRDEITDVAETVASEAVRMPSYVVGAAKGALQLAEPVGTAIGDFARYLTGKEPRDTSQPVADPLNVRGMTEALPSGEDLRAGASAATGIELHDPTTTPGKISQWVVPGLGLARGAAKLTGLAKKVSKDAPAYVPMATSPRNPLIKEAIDTAKTEARGTGKQVAQTLPPQIKAILADPAAMSRFSPAERAIMEDVARNGWTQSTVTQIGRLGNPRSILALLLGAKTGFASMVGAKPLRMLANHFTAKNEKILNGIVGVEEKAAPAAARAAPAAEAAVAPAVAPAARAAPPAAAAAPRATPVQPPVQPRAAPPEPVAPVTEAPPAPADPAARLEAISAAPRAPPAPAEGDFAAALEARRYEVAARPTKPVDREAQSTLDRLKAIREGGNKPLPKAKAKPPAADVVLPPPKAKPAPEPTPGPAPKPGSDTERIASRPPGWASDPTVRAAWKDLVTKAEHKSYGGATAHFKNTVAKHAKRKPKSANP